MKKIWTKLALLAILVTGVSLGASAQIYVTVHPRPPVIIRTERPSPAHVWIDEEWEPRGGTYVYAGGHWAAPPHPGWAWAPGHWRRGPRGEYWVGGHWRKGRRY
jgi:hypothetical protein